MEHEDAVTVIVESADFAPQIAVGTSAPVVQAIDLNPRSPQRDEMRHKALASMPQDQRQVVYAKLSPCAQTAMMAIIQEIDPPAALTLAELLDVPTKRSQASPKGQHFTAKEQRSTAIKAQSTVVQHQSTSPHPNQAAVSKGKRASKANDVQPAQHTAKGSASQPFGVLDQLCASRMQDKDEQSAIDAAAQAVRDSYFSKLPWLCSTTGCDQPSKHDGCCDPDKRQGPRKRKPKQLEEEASHEPVHPPAVVRAPVVRKPPAEKKQATRVASPKLAPQTDKMLCGVISTRGVACKQARDICPYHRKKQGKARRLDTLPEPAVQSEAQPEAQFYGTEGMDDSNNQDTHEAQPEPAVPKFSY